MKIGDLIPIGAVGNAVASNVLQGKTFSSSQGTDLTGAMPNNGVLSKTITTQGGTQKISPGYYEGGEIMAQFSNLTPGNIKKGVNIGGVIGNMDFKFSTVEIKDFFHKSTNSTSDVTHYVPFPNEVKGKIIYGIEFYMLDRHKWFYENGYDFNLPSSLRFSGESSSGSNAKYMTAKFDIKTQSRITVDIQSGGYINQFYITDMKFYCVELK